MLDKTMIESFKRDLINLEKAEARHHEEISARISSLKQTIEGLEKIQDRSKK